MIGSRTGKITDFATRIKNVESAITHQKRELQLANMTVRKTGTIKKNIWSQIWLYPCSGEHQAMGKSK